MKEQKHPDYNFLKDEGAWRNFVQSNQIKLAQEEKAWKDFYKARVETLGKTREKKVLRTALWKAYKEKFGLPVVYKEPAVNRGNLAETLPENEIKNLYAEDYLIFIEEEEIGKYQKHGLAKIRLALNPFHNPSYLIDVNPLTKALADEESKTLSPKSVWISNQGRDFIIIIVSSDKHSQKKAFDTALACPSSKTMEGLYVSFSYKGLSPYSQIPYKPYLELLVSGRSKDRKNRL